MRQFSKIVNVHRVTAHHKNNFDASCYVWRVDTLTRSVHHQRFKDICLRYKAIFILINHLENKSKNLRAREKIESYQCWQKLIESAPVWLHLVDDIKEPKERLADNRVFTLV